ncbi:MAG: PKD domain-containing protein, partial [Armatimonadetes bacterium]|nr:PKD domain-containing protein [Armatimonadota bacterium]
PPAPVADFSGSPTSGPAPLTVNFTDSSTNTPTSWSWTFGDGGSSTAQNPSHQYTSAGDYTVSLTATNAGGHDTETKTNYISVSEPPPPAPVADFSGSPTSGPAPLTVNFTDSSTNTPTSWSWTFGDGGSSTAQNPSHQYTSTGDYTVSLTATNAGGQDIETKTNYISVTAATTLLEDGFESNFDKWTDGGTTDWDRATSQKHTGSYSAHAGSSDNDLISDNLNSSGYSSITIEFWYRDDDIDDGDNIYLQLYDGGAYDNKFELGNSTEDTWNYYTTTINNSGDDAQYFISNFRIKFEGSSIDTGENLWIDDVKVTALGAAPPVADFSGSPTSGSAPLTVNFTDSSTNTPTSWSWTFGDTSSSTAQNPSHDYTSAGDYTVSLTATNAQGQDTETKTNYVSVTEPGGQETIYFNDFSSGLTGWYVSGDITTYTGDPKIGTHSVQMAGASCWMWQAVSTVGYTDIVLRAYIGAKDYEASENFDVEWNDGTGWVVVKTILNGYPEEDGQLHFVEIELPSSADDNASFRISFGQWNTDSGDYGYVDNVEVLGTPE